MLVLLNDIYYNLGRFKDINFFNPRFPKESEWIAMYERRSLLSIFSLKIL